MGAYISYKVFKNFTIKKGLYHALSRASPISTDESDYLECDEALCQCPISGFSHFYKRKYFRQVA